MLSGEKILVTGPAGQIGVPLASWLARDHEVWGVARFSNLDARASLEAAGVRTYACDLATGSFDELPSDFTYVVHLAATQAPGLDYDNAIRVNAEGTGLLLAHCRKARAALVMSTHSVYAPDADPLHAYVESDPLGDSHPFHSPPYGVSKIAEEAVARYCARAYDLPVVIARMNAAYGDNGGLPVLHLDAVAAGQPVTARWDPLTYSPIHADDIHAQVGALLDVASVPARIVNWAGDVPVSVQEWCAYAGELTGQSPSLAVRELAGTQRGAIADVTARLALTGPCSVDWHDGLRRAHVARHS